MFLYETADYSIALHCIASFTVTFTNRMQSHIIPCNAIQFYAISCNTNQTKNAMKHHGIPDNTIQYRASQ